MTRTGAIKWVGCAVVTLLAVSPAASSQSLAPDAHGFLCATTALRGDRDVTNG